MTVPPDAIVVQRKAVESAIGELAEGWYREYFGKRHADGRKIPASAVALGDLKERAVDQIMEAFHDAHPVPEGVRADEEEGDAMFENKEHRYIYATAAQPGDVMTSVSNYKMDNPFVIKAIVKWKKYKDHLGEGRDHVLLEGLDRDVALLPDVMIGVWRFVQDKAECASCVELRQKVDDCETRIRIMLQDGENMAAKLVEAERRAEEYIGLLAPVYGDIQRERIRQDEQWGGPEHDDRLAFGMWAMILTKQAGAVANAALRWKDQGWPLKVMRDHLVKVAAVAIAWAESIDRRRGNTDVTD